MAVVYAKSEFTDEKGTDWLVQIVDGTISSGHLNYAFTLGPDGFRLSYDFDNFDRAKPIIGSRVQFTLYHNDTLNTEFNALYAALDTAVEGTYRVEIYRDQDSSNEAWWVGEILPEQVIIPDEFPSAPVQITAVDGLGNLKGIDYNNAGSAYTGTEKITGHIYNCLTKVHSANTSATGFWAGGDVLCAFFEDFIGKEYNTYISSGQNQQLYNARVGHDTFYNLDEDGTKQYFSAYEVLESICIAFNSCIFMAQGKFWFVPLGAIQSHASNALDIYHEIRGGGVVTYNTSANVTYSAAFGNNSADFEKLAGWERSSTPAFKEVKRVRDYQGDKPILYRSELAVNTLIQDEDAARPQGQQLLVAGKLNYYTDGIGSYTGEDKIARIEISITLRVGDAGGTSRYLKRGATYTANSQSYVALSNGDGTFTHYFYEAPQYEEATWDASSSSRMVIVGNPFDVTTGIELGATMVNPIYDGNTFSFITPPIPADASGLQLEVDIAGIDHDGVAVADWSNSGNATFYVSDVGAWVYDNDNSQEFGEIDITAFNNDDARYKLEQGKTFIGDRITDSDLGTIKIYNGSAFVLSTEWYNSQSATTGLSINGLGVKERLAANKKARRTERGTLLRVGTKFLHPYSILTNSDEGTVYYQVTGLDFVASRCEYDVECMFLSRDIADITIAQDNPQPSKGDPWPTVALDSSKMPTTSDDTVLGLNNTKSAFLETDTHGLTELKVSTGSGTQDIILLNSLPTSGHTNVLGIRGDGRMDFVVNGTAGQVLTVSGGATTYGWANAPGAGWLGSTTRIKILPRDFVANDVGRPLMMEDDSIGSNELFLHSFSSSDMFASIPIPTGYTATHVKIFGSDTSQDFYVYEADIDSKTIAIKGTATSIGTEKDITDVASDTTNYLIIRVTSDGSTDEVHGGYVTITAS
jgi:hypothetical protein